MGKSGIKMKILTLTIFIFYQFMHSLEILFSEFGKDKYLIAAAIDTYGYWD